MGSRMGCRAVPYEHAYRVSELDKGQSTAVGLKGSKKRGLSERQQQEGNSSRKKKSCREKAMCRTTARDTSVCAREETERSTALLSWEGGVSGDFGPQHGWPWERYATGDKQ